MLDTGLITTLVADVAATPSVLINPMEFSYFTQLSPDDWKKAKHHASKLIQKNQESIYSAWLNNYATIEKAGEMLVNKYFAYYHRPDYARNRHYDPLKCAFVFNGKQVSVHTRMLRTLDNVTADGLRINTRKFFPMVPEVGLLRNADIYMFCGFDVVNRDGFVFGWSSGSDIAILPIDYELQVPAKCVPIPNLRPLKDLE